MPSWHLSRMTEFQRKSRWHPTKQPVEIACFSPWTVEQMNKVHNSNVCNVVMYTTASVYSSKCVKAPAQWNKRAVILSVQKDKPVGFKSGLYIQQDHDWRKYALKVSRNVWIWIYKSSCCSIFLCRVLLCASRQIPRWILHWYFGNDLQLLLLLLFSFFPSYFTTPRTSDQTKFDVQKALRKPLERIRSPAAGGVWSTGHALLRLLVLTTCSALWSWQCQAHSWQWPDRSPSPTERWRWIQTRQWSCCCQNEGSRPLCTCRAWVTVLLYDAVKKALIF